MTKPLPLEANKKLDIEHILENLENYHPPRKAGPGAMSPPRA
jgi:hypothetical protein